MTVPVHLFIKLHQELLFSGRDDREKGYTRHLFLGQITLQLPWEFIISSSDPLRWEHDTQMQHWQDIKVRELLLIRREEEIRRQVTGTVRDTAIYKNISNMLSERRK
ncbi:hypothetical protein N1851_007649 [Merluccius polli]|uniref:Uncharacterized protein n=1 Tax=Merluccius polli TaxID=89951 RepID=A0AA47N2S0_MERPO|nr:hypothetical protein N1851_007649 [Merluccius polli]